MIYTSFISYLRNYLPRIPFIHWVIIGIVSLIPTVLILRKKKYTIYGSIAFFLTLFIGLFLLDELVLKRIGADTTPYTGINLRAEYKRLVNGTFENRLLILFNVVLFIPFGIVLSEYLTETRLYKTKRCLGRVALIAMGLSLFVEILQLVLREGLFELTDITMNTIGALIGALMALGCRRLIRKKKNINVMQ